MTTEFFKITKPTGEVIFERREGRAPSARAREAREEFGAGTIVGMTTTPPPECMTAEEREFKIGEFVTVEHIGIRKAGRIVKIGRTRVHVEVPIHGGKATKIITRAKTEVRR